MVYILENGKLKLSKTHHTDFSLEGKYVGIFNSSEILEVCEEYGISSGIIDKSIALKSPRFESRENLNLICIPLIDFKNSLLPFEIVYIFMKKECLIFVCEDTKNLTNIINGLGADGIPDTCFEKLLYDFFETVIAKNVKYMDHLEQRIVNLEDELLVDDRKKDYIERIVRLRKSLLALKRYYEQLLDIFSLIDINENSLFDSSALRGFRILSGKIDRLYHSVINLRDYVTQIREAYQSQVDISLNKAMQFMTVLASIFLPLTLITGWYGMNFSSMPELKWQFGYPAVMAISLVVVCICIYYFKKNKWF
jgi:magnesium transporter